MADSEDAFEARERELDEFEREIQTVNEDSLPGLEDEPGTTTGTIDASEGTDSLGLGTLDEGATGRLEGRE